MDDTCIKCSMTVPPYEQKELYRFGWTYDEEWDGWMCAECQEVNYD